MLANLTNWTSEGFSQYDANLFGRAFAVVNGTGEGGRIIRALKDTDVLFKKQSLGQATREPGVIDLGHVGKTTFQENNAGKFFAWAGALPDAIVLIDLAKIQRAVADELRRKQVLAWVIFHELRHIEAKVDDTLVQLKVDRALDFYLYPSDDDSEERFHQQAGLPLAADANGRITFKWGY